MRRMSGSLVLLALIGGCVNWGAKVPDNRTVVGITPSSPSEKPPPAGLPPESAPGVEERFAAVNGVRLHYLFAGKGPPVILVHGFGETSHMWLPLIEKLETHHTVIAPDLRGAGRSEKPDRGYDKKTLAADVRALAGSLGISRTAIVGHDIGAMVAYAYAAQHPEDVDRVVLLDAFLPGVADWKKVWLAPDLWHLHFLGDTPLKLVAGRERIYLDHLWNDLAADPKHSLSESDRRRYAESYAQPDAMRAGFASLATIPDDATDFAPLSQTKLEMPVLVLAGEKSVGSFFVEQAKSVANDVRGDVVTGTGHWLLEESPGQVIPAIVEFLGPLSGER